MYCTYVCDECMYMVLECRQEQLPTRPASQCWPAFCYQPTFWYRAAGVDRNLWIYVCMYVCNVNQFSEARPTFEHGGPPWQDDVLVEASAHVDRTLHYRLVHHIRQRYDELPYRENECTYYSMYAWCMYACTERMNVLRSMCMYVCMNVCMYVQIWMFVFMKIWVCCMYACTMYLRMHVMYVYKYI